MKKIKWDSIYIKFIEITLDILIILASYCVALIVVDFNEFTTIFNKFGLIIQFSTTSFLIASFYFIFFLIYKSSITHRTFTGAIFRIFLGLSMTALLLLLISLIYDKYGLSRLALIIMLPLQALLLSIIKYNEYIFLREHNIKTTLLIGPRSEVEKLAIKILIDDNKYLHLKYLIFDDSNLSNNQIVNIANYINEVDFLYITEGLSNEKKNLLVTLCYKKRKKFFIVPKLYELAVRNSKAQQIGDIMLYEPRLVELSIFQRIVKRLFDLTIALIALTLSFPLMVIVGLLIKIDDNGPIFLKQERITRYNKKFLLIKFRTMIPDAETKTGPVLATIDDLRITRIGKFLRKTRIDELPQLINIIKGDMSLVGPRPEREYFINQFQTKNSDYAFRLNVKSGITGLAQAFGTYSSDFNEKLRFDISYITNYSFFSDIYILLHTIRSIFDSRSSRGCYNNESISKFLNEASLEQTEISHDPKIFLIEKMKSKIT